jgi:transcriptional regulator with XRE-family HTH domain
MATDPRTIFGQRLAEVRKAKGFSQEGLALESGLDRSYLGGVERGQRNIALLNIYRLAKALKVSPAYLLEAPVDREAIGQPDTGSTNGTEALGRPFTFRKPSRLEPSSTWRKSMALECSTKGVMRHGGRFMCRLTPELSRPAKRVRLE